MITHDEPDRLARLLNVLSVSTRVRIVQLLKGRALCVKALSARLNVTQGAVSQHLRIMRDVELVIDERRGNHVHYHLNEDTLATWRKEIDRLLDPSIGVCTNAKEKGECTAAKTRRKNARGREAEK